MPDYLPASLFASVGAICATLALMERISSRRLPWLPTITALFSALCFASNYASARDSIRVDLLLTIPLVSLAGFIVGARAMLHPPAPARVVGTVLALGAGIVFAWCSWMLSRSTAEGARAMAAFEDGRRLYWNESIRCASNFATRFGPIPQGAQPCSGDLVVASRSAGAIRLRAGHQCPSRSLSALFAVQRHGGQDWLNRWRLGSNRWPTAPQPVKGIRD
jgi:hypothetical protein